MPFLGAAAPAILGGLGGILGGVAGGIGSKQTEDVNKNVGPLDQNALSAQASAYGALGNIQNQVNAAAPYTNNAQASFAQMLQQMSQSGGLPNQQQVGAAQQYAQNIFAPQQAALQNQFSQSQIDTNRLAANLGRPVNDPVLQGKLAQYQGQQQAVLQGQQGAFANQLALGLPQQQLGYAQQLAGNAMQNQNSILSLGSGLLQQAQNYNLNSAGTSVSGQSGGGLAGGLLGGLSGVAGGIGLGNMLNGPSLLEKLFRSQNPNNSGLTAGSQDAWNSVA